MSRTTKLISFAAGIGLVLGLSACSAQGGSAEPYGGQCDLIASPLLSATSAFIVPGSANFSDMDLLQAKVWEAGYESIATWMVEVESVQPFIELLDTSLMSAEEAGNIEYLNVALSEMEVNKAVIIGDSDWYTKTYNTLISVGAACDAS